MNLLIMVTKCVYFQSYIKCYIMRRHEYTAFQAVHKTYYYFSANAEQPIIFNLVLYIIV